MLKITSTAAAIVLVGVLAGCSDDEPPTDPAAEESQSAAAEAAPECPAVRFDHDVLDPGCWAIQVRGLVDSPLAELRLPSGFSGNDAWVWVNAENDDEWGAITLMPTGGVFRDPCTHAGKRVAVGSSVEDFTRALIDQKLTRTTTPVPVSLGGHEGVYLELSVPVDFDISRCAAEEIASWQAAGELFGGTEPGYVQRYWVVDVEGKGMVLSVATTVDAPDRTVDLFTGIAESATFAEG